MIKVLYYGLISHTKNRKEYGWEEENLINIVVCDDDMSDLNKTVDILSSIFVQHEVSYDLKTFISSIDLLEGVKKVDIAILDISMEYLNGIDLGRKLKVKFPDIKIIYITSFEKYCLQAINDIHAHSFLCKPLQKEKMENQILDLLNKFNQEEDTEKIFYKVSNEEGYEFPILKLKLKDIVYFEYIKSKRRIAMILANEEYEFSYVMKKLVAELEIYGFMINSRGNLVNLRHIVKIKGYIIYLDNGKVLNLSQKRAVEFKEKMNMFIHNNI